MFVVHFSNTKLKLSDGRPFFQMSEENKVLD